MKFKHLISIGVLASSLILGACAETQLAEGGIGGTGISVGPITGFGSIIQNGVRYDVSQARFTRDGVTAPDQSQYRIGEIVKIQGIINPDGVTGTATQVDYGSLLQGQITALGADGKSLYVLNQLVRVDSLTLLHGVKLVSDLAVGNIVQISGARDAQAVIRANSLTLQQNSFLSGSSVQLIEGRITQVDPLTQTFSVNGLKIDYSRIARGVLPVVNQYVRVTSKQSLQNELLIASDYRLAQEFVEFVPGEEAELEGLVTAFISPNRFAINGQLVVTTAKTEFENSLATDIKLNALVEAEGQINNQGELIAEEISVRQASRGQTLELEGKITAIDPTTQTLKLLGNTLVVDASTILLQKNEDQETTMRFADLQLNDHLEIKARQLGDGRLLALRIERDLEDLNSPDIEIKGIATAIDRTQGSLKILGLSVTSDTHTEFELNSEEVSQAAFFARLVAGKSVVKVEGTQLTNQVLKADSLELDTEDD
ncbi:DUF5666 domain-containing protein [uncultured Thiothrix sp.]|uniref:DUF5666 domain-containing protein n=1 Tax=uncultured Thiothrix sp. TaxID=223185 RepID=UPI00260D5DCD|nr:DUF5666 domain-containing protein [uncultured Thiothrix sp.]